jgi:hypothetical protein
MRTPDPTTFVSRVWIKHYACIHYVIYYGELGSAQSLPCFAASCSHVLLEQQTQAGGRSVPDDLAIAFRVSAWRMQYALEPVFRIITRIWLFSTHLGCMADILLHHRPPLGQDNSTFRKTGMCFEFFSAAWLCRCCAMQPNPTGHGCTG